MDTRATVSQTIAEFALSLQLADVPAEILEHGKLLLTDTFGVAMSCQNMDHACAVGRAVESMGSAPQATLWGTGKKASIPDAALYNAALIHGADYDDTYVAGIVHPSASVVAAALTAGEYAGSSGKDILTAIVAGWEIITRLALASKGRLHDRGFHVTGVISAFAAACVAARLMGDSHDVLTNALGICGSQAAGIQAFLQGGAWTKKIHPGWGVHSALYALAMAREGFTGPDRVFEGEFGVWMTHCGGADGLEEAFSDLGRIWHTGKITVKLYPVCHMTHSFIDCMRALMEEHDFTAADIESVECRIESRCYPIVCVPREVKTRPATDYVMRFSLPYVLAMAAVKGRVSPGEIDLRYARDLEICGLMDRIRCVEDDTKRNPGHFPGYLIVTLKDGRMWEKDQRWEMGTEQNPLSIQAVQRKLSDNLEPFYSQEQIQNILNHVERLQELPDVKGLIAAFQR